MIRYISTRGASTPLDFRGAVLAGLAPDGGLYLPDTIPKMPEGWKGWDYVDAVSNTLELFGAEKTDGLVEEAASRFHHPEVAPIVELGGRHLLELFWGPTLSFKDHALQVLSRLLAREVAAGVVLGATSGDTGSAAMEAFRGLDNVRVVILFPEGRVSEFQRRQMTTAGSNTTAVAVRGSFDDCQRLVKNAFSLHEGLMAVNSINWARIAAQAGFWVHAAARMSGPFDAVVPTGNFGNVYSCWLAKQMGAPIERITIATNANRFLVDLVNTGRGVASRVIPTRAPAMDIQAPSNLERFTADPRVEFAAGWASDIEIAETMASVAGETGYRMDPHTAAAWHVGTLTLGERPQLVAATAHPAKFDPAITPPDWFPSFEGLAERVVTIDAELTQLEPLLH